MALNKNFVDPSKYDIKCPYEMSPEGVCIHNTYNDAPAKNEVAYMKGNNNEVSFHVAVDDVEAIQAIPFNRNAWAAGDGGKGNGNRKYIHVEICYSKSGGSKFIESEKRAAKEIAAILKSYGWGIDRVKKHQDFSGKYCPHRTLDMGYNRMIDMIKAELGSADPSNPVPPSNPAQPTGTYYRVVAGSYSVRENAEALVEKLKAEGVNAFLLPVVANDGKNYLRVIAGSYKDRANAEKQMKELIDKGYNAFIAVYDNEENRVPSNPQPPKPQQPSGIFVKNNEYHTLILKLQKELNRQGYRDKNGKKLVENGYNGPLTASAASKCIITTGIKGNITQILQEMFYAIGLDPKGRDGHCGPGMTEAIKSYNKTFLGLNNDPYFGPGCWKKILGQ
jgi:N-acetylmuramoyl-L-alanine amidase CwlA